jgi:superfamily II DNA or RNA helicase
MLNDFKSGKLRALTNANVLTTGFDYPDIDLIAMLRPTMSASLYVQMAGRGMRVKSHTDHCLVLDFAGVVETHGPITAVQPPEEGRRWRSPGQGVRQLRRAGAHLGQGVPSLRRSVSRARKARNWSCAT